MGHFVVTIKKMFLVYLILLYSSVKVQMIILTVIRVLITFIHKAMNENIKTSDVLI